MFDNSKDTTPFSGKDFTPMKENAFALSPEKKIELIEEHFSKIIDILGLDLTDNSLKNTPKRVAKMYVNEIFGGLLPENFPAISNFTNNYDYSQMLVEKNISVYSTCEHHFQPIVGKAHIAYIANGQVIGLSKINRIVNYFARRPQVQERLTVQIVEALKQALQTEDVACMIDAKHFCIHARGIRDTHCNTITTEFSGKFKTDNQTRTEFLQYIGLNAPTI